MTVLSRLLPVTRHTAPTHRRIHQTTLVRFFASSFRDSAAQLRSAFYTPTARADALAYCEKLLSDHAATRGSGSILSEKPVEQDTRAVPASAESHEGENSSEDSSTEKGSKKSAGVIPVRSFEAPLWNLPLIVEGLPDAPRVTERAELLSRVPEKLARSPLKVSAAFLSGLKLHGAAALAAEADGEAQFVMAARRNAALVVWEVEEETEKLVGQVYLALAEGCAAVNVVLMGGSAPHTSEVLGAVFQGLPVDVVCCRRGGDTSSDTSAELPEGLRTEALVDVLKEVSVIASNDSRLKKELMTKAVMEGENFALLNGAGGNAGHVGCGAALGFLTAGIRRRAPLEWRDKKDDFHRYELSDRSDDLISLLDSQQAFHDEISLYLDFLRTFAEQSKLPFLHPNIHVALTSEDRVPEVVTKLAMLTDMVPPELLVPGGKSDPFVTLHVFPGAVRKDPVKGFLRMASRMEGWTVDLQTRNWEELAGKLGEAPLLLGVSQLHLLPVALHTALIEADGRTAPHLSGDCVSLFRQLHSHAESKEISELTLPACELIKAFDPPEDDFDFGDDFGAAGDPFGAAGNGKMGGMGADFEDDFDDDMDLKAFKDAEDMGKAASGGKFSAGAGEADEEEEKQDEMRAGEGVGAGEYHDTGNERGAESEKKGGSETEESRVEQRDDVVERSDAEGTPVKQRAAGAM